MLLITVWDLGLNLDPPVFVTINGRLVSKHFTFLRRHRLVGNLKNVLKALRMQETNSLQLRSVPDLSFL